MDDPALSMGSAAPPGTPTTSAPLDHQSKNLTMLLAVIVVLVVIAVAIYVMFGGAGGGGGGGGGATPCTSPSMPSLAAGLTCSPGDGGQIAWLSATDTGAAGVATPTGLSQLNQWTASASDCVSETDCQAKCLGDKSCAFYTYDMSAVPSTACTKNSDCGSGYTCTSWCASGKPCKTDGTCPEGGACSPGVCALTKCPAQKAVCTTYKGSLPGSIAAGTTPYVTGGIPSSLLPPSKGSFTPRMAYPTDQCGNFGADACPHLGDRFTPRLAYPTDQCGNFGADACPHLRYPYA